MDNTENKQSDGDRSAMAACSAHKFTFAATFPKGHKSGGGSFNEGEFEGDNDDFKMHALMVFTNLITDAVINENTCIEFKITPSQKNG